MRANTTAHAILDRHAEAFIAELREAEFIDRGQGQYLDPADVKAAFMGPIQDAMQKERLRPLTQKIRLEAEKLLDDMSQKGLITPGARAHVDLDDLVDRVRKVLALAWLPTLGVEASSMKLGRLAFKARRPIRLVLSSYVYGLT